METVQSMAGTMLVNLALGVITLLGAYAVYYIRRAAAKVQTQTAQIKDEAGRKLLTDALADVENLAAVTVGSLEQTTAKALRAAVKDGKADRTELTALATQAFTEIKAAVAPAAQQVITENLGSFDSYLTKLIEDSVRRVKQEAPSITLDGEAQDTGA